MILYRDVVILRDRSVIPEPSGDMAAIDLNRLAYIDSVPVNVDFRPDHTVGWARDFRRQGSELLANIEVLDEHWAYLTPCAAILMAAYKLTEIGLAMQNVDPEIKPLSEYLTDG